MTEVLNQAAQPVEQITFVPQGEAVDLLTAQVRATRRNDTISRLSQLSLGSATAQGVTAGIAVGEVLSAGISVENEVALSAGVIGLTAAWSASRTIISRVRARSRIHASTQDTLQTGQDYELFRSGHVPTRRQVSMLWRGPIVPKGEDAPGTIESLQLTADMAKQAGVDTILIPKSLFSEKIRKDLGDGRTMRSWLFTRKQRVVSGGAVDDIVIEQTPAEWEAFADRLWLSESVAVQALLRQLGKIDPDHVLIRTANDIKKADKKLTPKTFATAIQNELVRHMDSVGAEPNYELLHRLKESQAMPIDVQGAEAETKKPSTEQQQTSDPSTAERADVKADAETPAAQLDPQPLATTSKRVKSHLRVLPTGNGEWANVFSDDKWVDLTKMGSMLGISADLMVSLINDPELNPYRAEQAIEIALLREVLKLDRQKLPTLQSGAGPAAKPSIFVHYEDQFSRRITDTPPEQRRTRLYRQLLVKLAATGMIGLAAGQSYHAVHDHLLAVENVKYIQVEDRIAQEAGIPKSEINADILNPIFDDSRLESYVDAEDPRIRAEDYLDTITGYAATDIGPLLGETNPNTFCGSFCAAVVPQAVSGGVQIGNAGDGEQNQTLWNLSEHDESAEGLWIDYTSQSLTVSGGGSSIVSENWSSNTHVTAEQPLPESVSNKRYPHYIRISRNLVWGDISSQDGYTEFLKTPVLDGNTIVGGQLFHNGVPESVSVLHMQGGTEALLLPNNMAAGDTIDYWVAPANTKVRAVARVAIHALFPYDSAAMSKLLSSLDPDWAVQSPEARADSIAGYTSTKMQYDVNPMYPREFAYDQVLAQIIAQEIAHDEANCNVSNNIVELSDLSLNPAIGFMSSTANAIGLFSHNSHFFLVDQSGRTIDGTPGNISPSQQAYFEQSPVQPFNFQGIEWLILYSGLGALVFSKRRQIKTIFEGTRLALAMSTAAAMPDDPRQLQITSELANRVIYSGEVGLQGSSAQNRIAAIHAGKKSEASRAQAADLSTTLVTQRPDLHAPSVIRQLHQYSKVNRGLRPDVRRSARILTTAHVAYTLMPRGYKTPLQPKTRAAKPVAGKQ